MKNQIGLDIKQQKLNDKHFIFVSVFFFEACSLQQFCCGNFKWQWGCEMEDSGQFYRFPESLRNAKQQEGFTLS